MEVYPNHPQYGSIYFPFTQLIALLSIGLGNFLFKIFSIPLYEFSFRFTFLILELFLIYIILKKNKNYILFLISPIFFIESLSLHTDVQGILLLIIILESTSIATKGILMPNLFFIKPEGMIIYINLFIYYFFIYKKKKKSLYFIFYNFIVFLFYFILLFFLYKNQFISLNTWQGLIKQANIFNSLFLAYQPFILLIQFFINHDSFYSILFYRKYILPILILILTIFFSYLYKNKINKQNLIYKLILFQLIGFFLYKASWQPWYFFWFIPILGRLANFREIHYLSTILLLWYIPVIYLRIFGIYMYSLFFFSLFLIIILYFLMQKKEQKI
jgi:hypothetical protein